MLKMQVLLFLFGCDDSHKEHSLNNLPEQTSSQNEIVRGREQFFVQSQSDIYKLQVQYEKLQKSKALVDFDIILDVEKMESPHLSLHSLVHDEGQLFIRFGGEKDKPVILTEGNLSFEAEHITLHDIVFIGKDLRLKLQAQKGITLERVSFIDLNIPNVKYKPNLRPISLSIREEGEINFKDIWVIDNKMPDKSILFATSRSSTTSFNIDGMVWVNNSVGKGFVTAGTNVTMQNILFEGTQGTQDTWLIGIEETNWSISNLVGKASSWEQIIKPESPAETVILGKHGLVIDAQENLPVWASKPTLESVIIDHEKLREMAMKASEVRF